MRSLLSFLALFASAGTLVCCAIPALLVWLGLGATLAALVTSVPALVALSERKELIFAIAGSLLLLSFLAQRRAAGEACPADEKLARACGASRSLSRVALFVAAGIYILGALFAFVLPWLGA